MRKILGISLCSSERDYQTILNLAGKKIFIERIGTNGDFEKAKELFNKFDGQVDAFGLGGIDFDIGIGKKRYKIKEAHVLTEGIKTPVFDGAGIKDIVDKFALEYITKTCNIKLANKRVFMVCASNRSGMAYAFEKYRCKMIYGDFMFGLKLPIPVYSLKIGSILANFMLPMVTKLPYKFLYPISSEQKRRPKFIKYFKKADVIAGDFHYIRKYSPDKLDNKIIITTTTTRKDVEEMKQKGISYLITTTPEIEGRCFGSNIIEALLYSLFRKKLKYNEYKKLALKFGLIPSVKCLK